MKRLLFALSVSAMLTALHAQPNFERAPAGYSVPPSATPPVAESPSSPPPAGAGPLQTAKHYFNEKSWQLAIDTAEKADTSALSAAEHRELLYVKGRAYGEMGNQGKAAEAFNEILKEDDSDVWAGRAHWQLQPGLHHRTYLDVGSSKPLEHLRAADRILTDAKPDDLLAFYLSVINSNLPVSHFPQESDRDYVLSFFDKIVPLISEQEELLAGVQLRRQVALNVLRPDRTPDERLAGLRGIVSEFPRTRAAADAQWQVAQHYISQNDFIPALYELSLLTNQFAGTDEARRAAEEIERIKRPEAIFQLPTQFLPDEKVSFVLTSRNTSRVKFTAVPFDALKELRSQKVTRPDLKAVTGKSVLTENVSVDTRDDYLPTSRTVTLDVKKPGAYVLRAEVDGKVTCNALLVISNLALVGNAGPQGYEFWTVDAKTGKPKANTTIRVAHTVTTDQRWLTGQTIRFFKETAELKTGTDGFATFDKAPAHHEMFAVATAGDHVAMLDNVHWSPFSAWHDQPHGYLYTDRPVYRPEQTVYWRAIVRERIGGQYQVPPRSGYRITIRDSRGQEVLQQTDLQLSEFGTLQGELALPVDAPLGQYNIEIWGATSNNNNRSYGHGSFRVEEYKKPEFEVSVEAADDFAKFGQKVNARVEANYLFGSPVTDATVQYTVRRRPRFRIMWEHLTWHLDDSDLGWFEDAPDRPPTLHGSSGVIVAQGEGKLDANGQFTLTFDSTVPDDELKQAQPRPYFRGFASRGMIWPPAPQSWDFQIEVTVTDASRRNIDASQVIPVGLKALNLAAKTQRHLVSPGDNARVELKSMNLADKPVPTSGTLFVEKLVWNEDAEEDDITTISSQQVSIEASGSLVLDWRVPDDARGRLRFAYIVDDPFGGNSVAYADFYSAAPDDTDLYVRYQGVEIIADQTRYTVGDTARVMILSEYKDAVAWYWIDTGSGNLHKQVLPLPHRTNFVTVPITEAFVPNSKIHMVAVRDKQVIMDEVELVVPPTSKVINVEVLPTEAQVEPGQESRVTIRATDENGQPVSGEFSLSIFDDAITYIAPDLREDIRKAFYGMKRPLRTEVQNSLSVYQGFGGFLLQDSYLQRLGWDQHTNYFAFDDSMRFRRGEMAVAQRAVAAPAQAPPPMMPPPMAAGMAAESLAMEMADSTVMTKSAAAPEMPAIRADFRDSMFWSPTVRTDADGSATVSIKYPDSLTTWRMVAVGLTPDTRVGNATTETIARKKVMVRLQAPRFFRERDTLTISANLHNYTDEELAMETTLRATGVTIDGATTMPLEQNNNFMGNTQNVTVPAGGEKRLDWKVDVASAEAGEAVLNLIALSPGGSDAMQTTVPLLPHGIDKFVAWNGTSNDQPSTDTQVTTSGASKVITRTVSLPAERIRETSRLEILVNPSLASSIRDAIPYMIEYPYGCVEQTMSRFMPAAVAARAFQVLGYPLDRDLQEKLPRVTAAGLKRLADMQLPTGGWGWWANDAENLYMTGYVMHGLTLARDAEVSVDAAMFDRGLRRLGELRDDVTSKVIEQQRAAQSYWWPHSLHNLMFAEYVMTLNGHSSPRTLDVIWQRRDELSAHGLAMLARTMGRLGRTADAELVLRNMVNMVVITPENNTARWGRIDSAWRWYDDPVEATAMGLMAYLELKPDDPLVEQSMKWLVLNRQGGRWKSTKDTAKSVLALTQFMLQRNEAAKPMTIVVTVGERQVRTLNVDPSNFWDFDGRIILRGAEIPDGDFPVSFSIEGEGTLYYSIYAEYFTLEENIQDAGNEIYVTRTYEKLRREQTTETVNGQPVTTYKETWDPLKEGDPIASGDELRVTLKIKSLNDYEYLVFEDPKPAGTEPVDLQSGSRYADGLCSNMELRDKWVAFFITTLRQGEHSISYRVRAEIPGTFHVMPTTGYAMYFPPLRANSDEVIVNITDKE